MSFEILALKDSRSIAAAAYEREEETLRITFKPDTVNWPAPGSEDTELGVLMEPEVRHGEAEVYAGVQA